MMMKPVVDTKALVHASSKKKKVGECHGEMKSTSDSGSADRQTQCKYWYKFFRAHSLTDIVGYRSTYHTSHSCAYVYQVNYIYNYIVNYTYSGPGNNETPPWINGRECPGQMNHDFSFITSMVVSGYAVFKTNSCFTLV